jgi:hypothetical protein
VSIATTNRLLDAINAENATGAVAELDASAVFEGFGFCPGDRCADVDTILTALDIAASEDARLTRVTGTQRAIGDVTSLQVELRANSIRGGGAERLLFDVESEVKAGKVTSLRFKPASDAQTQAFLGTGTRASLGPRPVQPPAAGDGGLR